MLLKIICAAGVTGCFAFIGFEFAKALERQLSQVKELYTAVCKMESGIRFGNSPLREIFETLAREKDETGEFFHYTVEKMNEKLPIKDIWNQYNEKRSKNILPAKAISLLARCGDVLEESDTEASIHCLKMTQQELVGLHDELYADYKSKIKTYPAVGLLVGMFLSVLFL